MSMPLEFGKQQLEMHQYTVTELDRMGHKTFNELNELDSYYGEDDMPPYIVKQRNELLNEMRDYRTAIRRNKSSIKKIEVRIANLTK